MVRLVAAALLLAGLVAVALAVLGARGTAGPTAVAAGGRVEVALGDFRFAPQRISARRGVLTLRLRNTGRLGHAFRVRKGGRMWIEQPTLAPGESATVTRRLEPGDYRMFDPLSNYEELGMYGTLVVR